MRIDVLIFGGGAAGLWCLDRFRRAGYNAILVESTAIGRGQTTQAQGIIHGGGKYALRGVRDFAAVQAAKEMPERWRRSLAGEIEPDLSRARVLSDRCYLWLPAGSLVARMLSMGFISVVMKVGLLATPPRAVPQAEWPDILRNSAVAVYSLAEPVIATGSLLQALAEHHKEYVHLYDASTVRFYGEIVQISDTRFHPRSVVFAAGEGNAALLHGVGIHGDLMQRRPLLMTLLKGNLPPLFGHCIVGGKTRLTVTQPKAGIWQVGGELSERLANEQNMERARKFALSEIRRWLRGLDLTGVEIAFYRAARAEAQTRELRRPSGVHVSRVAPRVLVAWPTKLSLVPVLADEVFALATADLKQPGGFQETTLPWPTPSLARFPWEEAEWSPVH